MPIVLTFFTIIIRWSRRVRFHKRSGLMRRRNESHKGHQQDSENRNGNNSLILPRRRTTTFTGVQGIIFIRRRKVHIQVLTRERMLIGRHDGKVLVECAASKVSNRDGKPHEVMACARSFFPLNLTSHSRPRRVMSFCLPSPARLPYPA